MIIIMKRYNRDSNNANKEIIDITPDECELNIEVNNHIVCEIEGCSRIFTSGGSYLFHKRKSHPSQTQSTECGKKNKEVNFIYRYYCPVSDCRYHSPSDKYFTNRKYLKQHYGKVHGEKKFNCTSCTKRFVFERDLKRHKETCGEVFKCVTCNCPYTTPEAVLTHCRRHDHEAPSSAKSSRRGIKQMEKQNKNEKTGSSTETTAQILQPCIVIINQSSPQVNVDNTTHPDLQKICPKPSYSSAAIVNGIYPLPVCQSLCIGIPNPEKSNLPKGIIEGTKTDNQNIVNISYAPVTPLNQCVAGIQTDIYGVDTLCSNNIPVTSIGTQADPPLNLSSTGMQTSMSFLPSKKKSCVIAGTQTLTQNILDQAMKSADIPKTTQKKKRAQKSEKTSEVQTSTTFNNKRGKRKIGNKISHVSVGCGSDPIMPNFSFDELSSNWTQTNLSFFTQETNLLQNIETQTQTVGTDTTNGFVDLLSDYESPFKKQLLQQNLDLLADATLASTLETSKPLRLVDPSLGDAFATSEDSTSASRISKPLKLGDPALGASFSTSIDSESQTTTSASDMDLLVQYDNPSTISTVTDIQTQTVEEELLNFLMNNMETQTTEDLFPGFGLSDIETQTLTTEDPFTSGASHQTSPNTTLTNCSSVSTECNTLLLYDSLVTTETQTNHQSNLALLTDMETQTTFNTIDFFTDFTDSHTQTSYL